MDSLGVSRINFGFAIFIANLPCFHSLYRGVSNNSLGVSRIHYQFTNSKVTLNSPSISRFHHEFICFANIHYLSRRFSSMYLLLISQIYYRFTVCFAYSLSFWRIYLKFCDSLWIFAKSI